MHRIFSLASLLLASFLIQAQQIRLLKDIDSTSSTYNQLNYAIGGIIAVGDTAYLELQNRVDGSGLWINDFTSAGSRMLDRYLHSSSQTTMDLPITLQGMQYYFVRGNTEQGLRKTDGTIAGSELITDFDGFSVKGAALVGNEIIVVSTKYPDSLKLWRSDGTAAGTTLIHAYPCVAPDFVEFAVLGNLFFYTKDGSLYSTDGTYLGTSLVANINTAGNDSVLDLTVYNGRLWFTAKDASHGRELWSTDGTASGTQMFDNFNPFGNGVVPGCKLQVAAGRLFWMSNDGGNNFGSELRSTDGTSQGAVVYDFVPGTGGIEVDELFATKNHIYFNEQLSQQLCVADTAAVTALVPMATLQAHQGMVTIGDSLFLWSPVVLQPHRLWRTDGTLAGTVDITPPKCLGVSAMGTNGRALFFAGISYWGASYDSLYRSDGSQMGYVASPLLGPSPMSSGPITAVKAGNYVYFEATDGMHGREPWRTDGTTAGTIMLQDIEPGGLSGGMRTPYVWRDQVFFDAVTSQAGHELWRSDGSPAGTVMLSDIRPGPVGSNPINFFGTADYLFFVALDSTPGMKLWRTDGTAQGTVQVQNFQRGGTNAYHLRIIGTLGKELLMSVPATGYDFELWIADSAGGNARLLQTFPGEFNWTTFGNSVEYGNQAFFVAHDPTNRYRVWTTQGTPATTLPFSTEFGIYRFDVVLAGVFRGKLIYRAIGNGVGKEYFVTDGTPSGTQLLMDISPGIANGTGGKLAQSDSTLWFTADDGIHGLEMWATDGTTAGTHMLADLAPGALGCAFYDATVLEGELYAKYHEGLTYPYHFVHSDGTVVGTTSYGAVPVHTGSYDEGLYAATAQGILCAGTDGDHGDNLYLLHHQQVQMLPDYTGGDPRSLQVSWALPLAGGYVLGAATSEVGDELFFLDSLPEPPLASLPPHRTATEVHLTAYPVPAHEQVQLRLRDTRDAITHYTLTDLSGKPVRTGDARGQAGCAVALDGLAAGVYIAQVRTQRGATAAIKVVKE